MALVKNWWGFANYLYLKISVFHLFVIEQYYADKVGYIVCFFLADKKQANTVDVGLPNATSYCCRHYNHE